MLRKLQIIRTGKIILWDVTPFNSVEVHVSGERPASIFRVEQHVEQEEGGRFYFNSKTNACNLHFVTCVFIICCMYNFRISAVPCVRIIRCKNIRIVGPLQSRVSTLSVSSTSGL
jgi:hypothetical protein